MLESHAVFPFYIKAHSKGSILLTWLTSLKERQHMHVCQIVQQFWQKEKYVFSFPLLYPKTQTSGDLKKRPVVCGLLHPKLKLFTFLMHVLDPIVYNLPVYVISKKMVFIIFHKKKIT